jgi:hypothetical protein
MSPRPNYLKLVGSVEVEGFGLDTEKIADRSLQFEREAGERLKSEDDQIVALVLAAFGRINSAEGYKTFLSAVKVCRLASEGALATA